MGLFQSKQKKQEIAEARQVLTDAGPALASAVGPGEALAVAEKVRANQSLLSLPDKERSELTDRAFDAFVERLLADDILTIDEEKEFGEVSTALGLTAESFVTRHPALVSRLLVARVNDGRLEEIPDPQIICKPGEVVHLEVPAALMKEVAVREWQGGSQGFSFRVAKGVRYRVGQTRGRLVTVGSQMTTQDTGTFAVTSMRVAYLGAAKSTEILFTKMMGCRYSPMASGCKSRTVRILCCSGSRDSAAMRWRQRSMRRCNETSTEGGSSRCLLDSRFADGVLITGVRD